MSISSGKQRWRRGRMKFGKMARQNKGKSFEQLRSRGKSYSGNNPLIGYTK